MCEKLSSLSLEAKVCDACRKELSRVTIAATESADLFESSEEDVAASTHPAEETSYQLESLETINQCLSAIGETPIVKKKFQQTKYPREKMKKIRTAVKKSIAPTMEPGDIDDESEIIMQLKEKFQDTSEK